MATVLARDKTVTAGRNPDSKLEPDISTTSVNTVPPLGDPITEKQFWFQRAKSYGSDSIATQASLSHIPTRVGCLELTQTQPSVFDDPETAAQYQPRPDW